MELLVIWYALQRLVDWRWGVTSMLAAVPLTFVVLPSTYVVDAASGVRDNLGLLVSWTQIAAQVAIVVTGIVAVLTLLSQRLGWKTTTLWGFLQVWDGATMRKDRSRTARVLLDEMATGTTMDLDEYVRVLNFFEVIGLLVQRGAFSADDAWEWFSDTAKGYWIASKRRVDEAQSADPTLHKEFAFLINQFERIDRIRKVAPLKNDDVRRQLEYEARLDPGPVRVQLEAAAVPSDTPEVKGGS